MIDQRTVLLTMIAMLIVTYLPRLLPLWLFTSRSLPPFVVAWLRYVPVAVLAAMLLPALVVEAQALALNWNNLFLWASVPTFVVAWKTKSLFGAVIAGMLIVAGARFILG